MIYDPYQHVGYQVLDFKLLLGARFNFLANLLQLLTSSTKHDHLRRYVIKGIHPLFANQLAKSTL